MKESDIFREYARVVDMCEGTTVMPYHCVRFNGKDFDPNTYWFGVPGLLACDPVVRGEVEFAWTIVENKPVFLLDTLYDSKGNAVFGASAVLYPEGLSWLPPRHPMHEKEEPVRLVPTMQLRWVIGHKFSMVGNMSPNPVMILQQWFKDITTPDAAGHYPHGEWIIVPTEGMQ